MKIIKKGKLPQAKKKTCKYCGCVFEYNWKDVQIKLNPGDGGLIQCPTCEEFLHVD